MFCRTAPAIALVAALALPAHAQDSDRGEWLRNPAMGRQARRKYIIKPFAPDQLSERVQEILNKAGVG